MATNTNTTNTEEIGVIDLSATRKKKFKVIGIGNDDTILELNTSDLSVMNRLTEAYPRLEELDRKLVSLGNTPSDEEDSLKTHADILKEIDTEMKVLLDFIFDSNISEVCCPSGSMYDPFDGQMRWEHILDNIIKCYDTQMTIEMKKIKKQAQTHTAKYTTK